MILTLDFIDITSIFNFVFIHNMYYGTKKKESFGLLFNRSYNEVGKL